jgi:hypothetical protein
VSGIAFRASAAGGSVSSPMGITVPASIKPGDQVIVFLSIGAAGTATLGVSTTGATVPVLVPGSQVAGPATSFALFQFTAQAGDAGAALSFTSNLTPLIGILLAYPGAGKLRTADFQPFTAPASLTAVSPQFTPVSGGSWGIALAGANSGGPPTYAPGTFRSVDSFSVTAAYDTNGAARPVGGGTWTNNVSDVWWGYTVALRPARKSGLVPVLASA